MTDNQMSPSEPGDSPLLSGCKILLTGATGQIGGVIAEQLAPSNELWCPARFTRQGSRDKIERLGAKACNIDLAEPDFSALPEHFDYVLHLAVYQGFDGQRDYDYALTVNAEATGLLLSRFRDVRAALVMSTTGVYRPHEDPNYRYREGDPLGDAVSPNSPSYGISKIAEEAVARFCSREYDIPVVIARMNAAYGSCGGLPAKHLDRILSGETIRLRSDPAPYSPIFEDDVVRQIAPLLGAASVPATIVNWGGDEVVTAQEWCTYLAELAGKRAQTEIVPLPGSQSGIALDVTKRASLTGPCTVLWKEGMRRMFEVRAAA